jgi:hypothetical protein
MASTLRFDNWENTDNTLSSSLSEIVPAYAQFNKIAAQSFGTGFTTIALDETFVNKNIQLIGNNIKFSLPGVYKIDVGMRFGSATDAWTGSRLFNSTSGIVGISYGTGNVASDPGPVTFNFLANVTNASLEYSLQIYRNGGSWSQTTPDTSAGRAIVATIHKVG